MKSTIAAKKNEMLFTELLNTVETIDFYPSNDGKKVYGLINGVHYVYCSPAVQDAVREGTFNKEQVRYAELLFKNEENQQSEWQACFMMIGKPKQKALLSF